MKQSNGFDDKHPFDDTNYGIGCFLLMVAGGLIIAAIVIYFLLSLPTTYNYF